MYRDTNEVKKVQVQECCEYWSFCALEEQIVSLVYGSLCVNILKKQQGHEQFYTSTKKDAAVQQDIQIGVGFVLLNAEYSEMIIHLLYLYSAIFHQGVQSGIYDSLPHLIATTAL